MAAYGECAGVGTMPRIGVLTGRATSLTGGRHPGSNRKVHHPISHDRDQAAFEQGEAAGTASLNSKSLTLQRLVDSHGFISSDTTRRHCWRAVRVGLFGRHQHNADDDPFADLRHPLQPGIHRDCHTCAQLHDDRGADRGARAQHLPTASDAATRSEREKVGQQRPVHGVAETLYD